MLSIRRASETLRILSVPDSITQPAQLPRIAPGRSLEQLILSRRRDGFRQFLDLASDLESVLKGDRAHLDRLQGRLQVLQLAGQRQLAVGAGAGDMGVGANPVDGGVLAELIESLAAIEGSDTARGLKLQEVDCVANELELRAQLV